MNKEQTFQENKKLLLQESKTLPYMQSMQNIQKWFDEKLAQKGKK